MSALCGTSSSCSPITPCQGQNPSWQPCLALLVLLFPSEASWPADSLLPSPDSNMPRSTLRAEFVRPLWHCCLISHSFSFLDQCGVVTGPSPAQTRALCAKPKSQLLPPCSLPSAGSTCQSWNRMCGGTRACPHTAGSCIPARIIPHGFSIPASQQFPSVRTSSPAVQLPAFQWGSSTPMTPGSH